MTLLTKHRLRLINVVATGFFVCFPFTLRHVEKFQKTNAIKELMYVAYWAWRMGDLLPKTLLKTSLASATNWRKDLIYDNPLLTAFVWCTTRNFEMFQPQDKIVCWLCYISILCFNSILEGKYSMHQILFSCTILYKRELWIKISSTFHLKAKTIVIGNAPIVQDFQTLAAHRAYAYPIKRKKGNENEH